MYAAIHGFIFRPRLRRYDNFSRLLISPLVSMNALPYLVVSSTVTVYSC